MKESRRKTVWIPAMILLAVLLAMLAVNCTRFLYFTDEADNFLAGMNVAAGKMIYVDFTSQHMPLLYYICGLFSLLGASDMLSFRLCFYGLFALLWVLLCIRNRDRIGWFPFCMVPVLYVANMIGDYNVCVLSDQLQAYGMSVLFFEFCRFYDTGKADWKCSAWVSAGILVSFGCAFVSAFAIFAIVVGVLGVEIRLGKESGQSFGKGIGAFFRKYALLLTLTLAPLAIWVVCYVVSGHFSDLILGAFRLNTEYYPAYSGYQANPLAALLNPFVDFVKTLLSTAANFGEHKLLYAKTIVCCGINLLFLTVTWRRAKWKAVVLFCFAIWSGSRGFGSVFHALPYYAVTLCMLVSLFADCRESKTAAWRIVRIGLVLAAAVLLIPYLTTLKNGKDLFSEIRKNDTTNEDSYETYLQLLTEEDEEVLYATVDFYLGVNAQRRNADIPLNTPWTYEAYREEILQKLEEDCPRVMIFTPNYHTWGYSMKEYAAEAWNCLREKYRCLYLPSCPELYVRQDYYEEAKELCGAKYEAVKVYDNGTETVTVPAGSILTQTIEGNGEETDCVGFLLNTCLDIGGIRGRLRILHADGEELAVCETDFSGWKPYGFTFFEIPLLCFEEGETYTLELTVESTAQGTGIVLYETQDGDNSTEAALDGELQNGDICFGLFRVLR